MAKCAKQINKQTNKNCYNAFEIVWLHLVELNWTYTLPYFLKVIKYTLFYPLNENECESTVAATI